MDEVSRKVIDALMEALDVAEDEVKPEARIIADLKAESIDFLDITFRLEKAFGIKIDVSAASWWPLDVFNNSEYVTISVQGFPGSFTKQRSLTPAGVAELKRRYPNLDLSYLEKDSDARNFDITVETLVNYIRGLIQKEQQREGAVQ